MIDSHPTAAILPVLASPSMGKGKNTLRMELIPVACWKITDVRFAFGSSFVLPETRSEFVEFAELRKAHPGAPLSVFGHADPVDSDAFNKPLSGHRAQAIYAVLIRDVALWEKLHGNASDEGWGTSAVQHMLTALGHDPGPVTGSKNAQTEAAVRQFQSDSGLTADGDAGPKTRGKLYGAYMDFLSPVTLEKSDFLGKGADPDGKGDYQGCSEFNPAMVFSQAEQKELEKASRKTVRDAENAVNRRVVVLLFRPGSVVPPNKWPCPRAKEGTEGCTKRLWSDGNSRRKPAAERRTFAETRNTFACRFYHRLVVSSPCEGVDRVRVKILIDDPFLGLVGGIKVSVTYSAGLREELETDDNGEVELFGDQGMCADLEFATSIREHTQRVFLFPDPVETEDGVWQRLANLGYIHEEAPDLSPASKEEFECALVEFQAHHGITPTAVPDGETKAALVRLNDSKTAFNQEDRESLDDERLSDSANLRKDAVA